MRAQSLATTDTIYSADSIEWCPHPGSEDIFVCGTYQVLEHKAGEGSASANTSAEADSESDDEGAEQSGPRQTERTGRLLVFRVGEDESSFEETQRIDTAAILDGKWAPRIDEGKSIYAAGDAKGCITTYALDQSSGQLSQRERIQVADPTTLCLSLDWSHRLNPSSPSSLITSLSSGSVAHLIPTPTGLVVDQTFHAHDFEPWITSFDLKRPEVVWSGGDDCKLKSWDLRDTSRPATVNKRFDAGVTTITPSPHTPNLLAVGSYDSNLRIFDTRSAMVPLSTIPCAGGIWRTRFHPSPSRPGDILLACMHGGFTVVRLGPALVGTPNPSEAAYPAHGGETSHLAEVDWTMLKEGTHGESGLSEDIVRFEEHGSLAYGADWSRLSSKGGKSLVASCSFYDHAMHLWRA